MPDLITIYRGYYGPKKALRGMSWTIDQEHALWFANRAIGREKSYLATATIAKPHVLAYLHESGRTEHEIICFPENCTDLTVEVI